MKSCPCCSRGNLVRIISAAFVGLVCHFAVCAAVAQPAATQERRAVGDDAKAVSAKPHATPLSGTLVLWGGGEPTEEIRQTFSRMSRPAPPGARRGRGRGRRGRGARQGGGDSQTNQNGATQQQEQPEPDPPKIADWKPGEPLPEDIDQLDGLWVQATAAEYTSQVSGSDAEEEFAKMLGRGGAVAIPAIETELLPYVAIGLAYLESDRDSDDVKSAVQALKERPGTFGLGVAPETAVFLNRRRMIALGEEPAVVVLPASKEREVLFKEISGNRNWEDLVGLSRASLARLGETFPAAKPNAPHVENGSLLIVGGGGMTQEMWQTFIDSAGGPDAPLVVLPTASNPPNPNPGEARLLARMGATDVTVLAQNTPEGVTSDEFVSALKRAKGVWFGGGRQWNFVDAYEGTGAVELFHDVLRRGGIIAGSSAGASIQAEYMVRGSPLVNTIMMAEGYERGFGFLPGSAVDQHFFQRDRFADLLSVHNAFPQLMCFGVDETTGMFIRKNILQVMGRGNVAIYDSQTPPDEGKDYFNVATGEFFDLTTRKKITQEEAEQQLGAAEGAKVP